MSLFSKVYKSEGLVSITFGGGCEQQKYASLNFFLARCQLT